MKSKMKTVLIRTISALIVLMIGLVATAKLTGHPQVAEIYSRLGLLSYMPFLGASEILFTALFLWNRSMRLGLLLLTGYFGGAMAVELSNNSIFIIPAVILGLIWILGYLRDEFLFKSASDVRQT